jgi:hypothetical protein
MTPKAVWALVKTAAQRAGISNLAPHDLRRTCARLCYMAGGELDRIQFLLGHVSIQTTERYLGCKQKLRVAVNDRLGFEPEELVSGPLVAPPSQRKHGRSVHPSRLIKTYRLGRRIVLLETAASATNAEERRVGRPRPQRNYSADRLMVYAEN